MCEFLQNIAAEIQGVLAQGLSAEDLTAKIEEINQRIINYIQENCEP